MLNEYIAISLPGSAAPQKLINLSELVIKQAFVVEIDRINPTHNVIVWCTFNPLRSKKIIFNSQHCADRSQSRM